MQKSGFTLLLLLSLFAIACRRTPLYENLPCTERCIQVAGTITNQATSSPIEGITVHLVHDIGSFFSISTPLVSAETDKEGKYSLSISYDSIKYLAGHFKMVEKSSEYTPVGNYVNDGCFGYIHFDSTYIDIDSVIVANGKFIANPSSTSQEYFILKLSPMNGSNFGSLEVRYSWQNLPEKTIIRTAPVASESIKVAAPPNTTINVVWFKKNKNGGIISSHSSSITFEPGQHPELSIH